MLICIYSDETGMTLPISFGCKEIATAAYDDHQKAHILAAKDMRFWVTTAKNAY
jgi:hypothetical protein